MLKVLEKGLFEAALLKPGLFRKWGRRYLYRRDENDFGRVHQDALRLLNEHADVLRRHEQRFDFPGLEIDLNGQRVQAFGTAAGLDKNCDALGPLSYVFGFQEPGTVVIPRREGNKPPREAVDEEGENLYNAQGFPSEGIAHSLENLRKYSATGQKKPLYLSICGIPSEGEPGKALEKARTEMDTLLRMLNQYASGFVWNPFSPNTEALKLLRKPGTFREYAELMRKKAPDKLRLVKMGPYDKGQEQGHLELVEAFLDGGGHGVVGPNTYMVPKEEVPSESWGYKSAGKSGRFLRPYRQRFVTDTREAFPEAVIFATGGIYEGEDAYHTFKLGATGIEGYTPYTFYGVGLVPRIMKGVVHRLREEGHTIDDRPSLEVLQESVRRGATLLCNV